MALYLEKAISRVAPFRSTNSELILARFLQDRTKVTHPDIIDPIGKNYVTTSMMNDKGWVRSRSACAIRIDFVTEEASTIEFQSQIAFP
jgi:hypothetical protein